MLSHVAAGALAEIGLERRGEIVRLVMTMEGGSEVVDADVGQMDFRERHRPPGPGLLRTIQRMRRKILILGGSGEAAELARRLEPGSEFEAVTSLAGRTRRPGVVPGRVRSGGFGGAAGLRAWLHAEGVDVVVDATHPYAAAISRHAAQACDALGIPRIQLWRPAWSAVEGDRWIEAASLEAAAETVANTPVSEVGCVFLSTGARALRVFSRLPAIRFLVRLVDAPRTPLPLARSALIVGRGPFAIGSERTLFLEHGVELLVSRNSGGSATYPKLLAARELRIPVIMIKRPEPEAGPRVETAEEAFRWLIARA